MTNLGRAMFFWCPETDTADLLGNPLDLAHD